MILTGGVSAGGLIIGFLIGCIFCVFIGFLIMSCINEDVKDVNKNKTEHTDYFA